MTECIKVFARFRPLPERAANYTNEENSNAFDIIENVIVPTKQKLVKFAYDRVFPPETKQIELFQNQQMFVDPIDPSVIPLLNRLSFFDLISSMQ